MAILCRRRGVPRPCDRQKVTVTPNSSVSRKDPRDLVGTAASYVVGCEKPDNSTADVELPEVQVAPEAVVFDDVRSVNAPKNEF